MDMDNQQQKFKQPEQMGGSSGNGANVKSITNIYYDCLERIFDFLDLESLLNVANTCKRLQTAAVVKFGDVYGEFNGYLSIDDWNWGWEQGFKLFKDNIFVIGVKFCLPFLRCFGAKIPSLEVRYNQQKLDDNDYVDQYVNQYCVKTLKTISLRTAPGFFIGNVPNPFKCVEKVTIYYVNLAAQLPHFVHVFPNLRSLDLRYVTIDENHANVQFPKLEKFCIWFKSRQKSVFTTNLLLANPQLKELEIRMYFQRWDSIIPEVLNMISRNPSITKLEIWNLWGFNINRENLMRFAGEHLQIVELDLRRSLFTPQDAIIFIRQLKSLKLFRFSVNHQTDYVQLVGQLDSEWKHEHEIHPRGNHEITLSR